MFWLMRHAEASYLSVDDQSRALTQSGIDCVERLVNKHQQALSGIEKVICSPYLRAQQTANIITHRLALNDALVVADITPNNSVEQALQTLEKHWCDNLLVITHQPLIGQLICYLEYGDTQLFEPVTTSSIYGYSLPWPGLACAQRTFLFSE